MSGVRLQESPRSNFVMVPHIVWTMDLSSSARNLYVAYRIICGETGKTCWAKSKTLERLTGLGHVTIISARTDLEAAGLIKVVKSVDDNNNPTNLITVIDIWSKNDKHRWNEVLKGDEGPIKTVESPKSAPAIVLQKLEDTPTKNVERVLQKVNGNNSTNTPNKSMEKEHRRLGGVGTMNPSGKNGFDVIKEKKSVSPTEEFSHAAIDKLHKSIVAKGKLMRRPDLGKWRRAMMQFVGEHWEDRARIKSVLKWYCEHLGENDFIPKAYSVESFVDKFVAIEDAMRSNGYTKTRQEIEDDRLIDEGHRLDEERAAPKPPPRVWTQEEWDKYAEENDL